MGISPSATKTSDAETFRKEYAARIHRAQDFIEENLGKSLQLEEIAQAAHFSAFHFHRIYTATTGETLFQFIQRIRLERAASRLHCLPSEPITNIAIDLGFSSSATFARAFKSFFGISASEYRQGKDSKECKPLRKNGKASESADAYSGRVDSDASFWRNTMSTVQAKSIEAKDLPAKSLAYVRHMGPYASDEKLFEKLFGSVFSWAGPRGLYKPGQSETIAVYHDNPEITEQEKLRISVGVTVPPDTSCNGEISLMEIPAGQYVCAKFEIDVSEYGAAWNAVMCDWLPQSGWQPGEGPCYECYLNDPKQHPQGKHIFEVRMNVKPL